MRKRFLMIGVLWVVLVGIPLFAQDLTTKIDEVVDAYVALDQFSGTILVAKDGKPIYTRACGEADKPTLTSTDILSLRPDRLRGQSICE